MRGIGGHAAPGGEDETRGSAFSDRFEDLRADSGTGLTAEVLLVDSAHDGPGKFRSSLAQCGSGMAMGPVPDMSGIVDGEVEVKGSAVHVNDVEPERACGL